MTVYHCVCGSYEIRTENEGVIKTDCTATVASKRSRFAPGHDAKLKALLAEAWFHGRERLFINGYPDLSASALDHARLFSDAFALAVAKMIDTKSRQLQTRAASSASGLTRTGESRATRAVFKALQRPDTARSAWEPVGSAFSRQREEYVEQGKAWLRDRSNLRSSTIETADWSAIWRWFIHNESV